MDEQTRDEAPPRRGLRGSPAIHAYLGALLVGILWSFAAGFRQGIIADYWLTYTAGVAAYVIGFATNKIRYSYFFGGAAFALAIVGFLEFS
ncbi:hypothetical protein [Pannonibacter tanglangensis]|uniref:hypothetical protein n=1 Tax=Pannonibacter tanglangensis TaxID=2750084 RepID=UPI0015D1F874|nr:hypothetical protein [Pannonibacter sp. XCT-34]